MRAVLVCGTWWPLLLGTCVCALVVAGGLPLSRALWPRFGAPRLVRSGRPRGFGPLSRRRGAFCRPAGFRPRNYWAAVRGTPRLAEYRADCACRWPLPRQGRWTRSASYPFEALQWGCPWWVPRASVVGCVRCAGSACADLVPDASGFPYRLSFDQLPNEGNHSRRTAPAWKLPISTIDWKEILRALTTVDAINLITTKQIRLPPAQHLLITIQGTATVEGTTLGDHDQMPRARLTQAICVTTTRDTNIAIDPDSELAAIHYAVEGTDGDPKTSDWQIHWTTAINRLSGVTLNDTLTPQTMEPAKLAGQTYHRTAKHTVWHYPTTIHPEAVAQIKEALSLDLPDTDNAHQPGSFTTYWSFPTAASMVRQVAEHALPPTVMALAKAVQAMACREGVPLEWTPNTLVEQLHNATAPHQPPGPSRTTSSPRWTATAPQGPAPAAPATPSATTRDTSLMSASPSPEERHRASRSLRHRYPFSIPSPRHGRSRTSTLVLSLRPTTRPPRLVVSLRPAGAPPLVEVGRGSVKA